MTARAAEHAAIATGIGWRRVSPRLFIILGLAASVLTAFWPALHNGFVNYDDIHYLSENPYVRRGFTAETLWWALTTDRPNYWHPLTLLSHMVDWQLYGPAPAGHHATNLVLHVVNTLLVFLFFGPRRRRRCFACSRRGGEPPDQ